MYLKDYRIGVLVYKNGQIFKLTQNDLINMTDPIYKPIPLNEEWAYILGFNKKINPINKLITYQFKLITLTWYPFFNAFIFRTRKFNIPFHYVHDIQTFVSFLYSISLSINHKRYNQVKHLIHP